MKSILLFCLLYITAYAADEKSEIKNLQRNLQEICNSPRLSPRIDSPRKLTPSERERLAKQTTYIIERAERGSSPEMEKQIKFDQRFILAYNESTETFRMIKDESELQEGESPRSYSPRTEKSLREKFNSQE